MSKSRFVLTEEDCVIRVIPLPEAEGVRAAPNMSPMAESKLADDMVEKGEAESRPGSSSS